MNDNSARFLLAEPDPTCPQCGKSLQLTGKIVQLLTYKKWVNEWHCPDHGLIELEKRDLPQ